MALGRESGHFMPQRQSFHFFLSLILSSVLLTSNFAGSGSRGDVSFQMYLHMAWTNWILWPWLASLEILLINKPIHFTRMQYLYLSKYNIFGEAQAFWYQLILLSTVQPIVWTAAREWKRCATFSPKNKITSPCFEVFCKLLSAQGEPQQPWCLTDSSPSSAALVSFLLTPLNSLQFRFC